MPRRPLKTAAVSLAAAIVLFGTIPAGCAHRPRLFVGGGNAGGSTTIVAGVTFDVEERGRCRPEREGGS